MSYSAHDTITVSKHHRGTSEACSRSVLVIDGDHARTISLPKQGKLTIGRSLEADISLEHSSVSRIHARLEIRDTSVEIMDCDSHNGICVNGVKRSHAHPLVSGDVVALGEVTLVFGPQSVPLRRRFLSGGEFRERLAEETARALHHRRNYSLVVCHLDGASRAIVCASLESVLSTGCIVGWVDEFWLTIVAPEVSKDESYAIAQSVRDVCQKHAYQPRIGIAQCPQDGCDSNALLSVAQDVATSISSSEILWAKDASDRIDVGERSVVVAEETSKRVFSLIRRLAATDISVLVSGETGVGKEHAAYALHVWSPRKNGPFITINCAAIPESLVESELFGHRKGAFSGAHLDVQGKLEAANKGTLFLDELGELPLPVQAKLLRALERKRIVRVGESQERSTDFRVVAATHRDLELAVQQKQFRRDLYYRVHAASVALLPLRERPRELAILARMFVEEASARAERACLQLSDATMRCLATYTWPGNVRELKNAMDFAVAVADHSIEPWHLPANVSARERKGQKADCRRGGGCFRSLVEEVEELERRRMKEALEAANGVQTRAADLIGMPRRTFTLKVGKYKLRNVGRNF